MRMQQLTYLWSRHLKENHQNLVLPIYNLNSCKQINNNRMSIRGTQSGGKITCVQVGGSILCSKTNSKSHHFYINTHHESQARISEF